MSFLRPILFTAKCRILDKWFPDRKELPPTEQFRIDVHAMVSYEEYLSLPRFQFTNSTMNPIDEAEEFDEEIDLEFTDAETESFSSETESDKAFIVPDEIPSHGDATYEPSETGSSTDSESSTAPTAQDFQVLDKREVDGPLSKYTEYRVCFWVEERHLDTLLSLERLNGY